MLGTTPNSTDLPDLKMHYEFWATNKSITQNVTPYVPFTAFTKACVKLQLYSYQLHANYDPNNLTLQTPCPVIKGGKVYGFVRAF